MHILICVILSCGARNLETPLKFEKGSSRHKSFTADEQYFYLVRIFPPTVNS